MCAGVGWGGGGGRGWGGLKKKRVGRMSETLKRGGHRNREGRERERNLFTDTALPSIPRTLSLCPPTAAGFPVVHCLVPTMTTPATEHTTQGNSPKIKVFAR